jgi:exodeoxyribonuclease-3
VKIVSWNVNSLRVRLPQVLDWCAAQQPDVLCVQETKTVDADFPGAELAAAGFHSVYCGQKTYNGVALLSRQVPKDVVTEFAHVDPEQKRTIAASFGDARVVNLYVPNGSEVGSEKYAYKLGWLNGLREFLAEELRRYPNLIVLGDFNIAPDDRDVHDPESWKGSVLVSDAERAALKEILALGLEDVFRRFPQEPETYSWWDYRAAAFRRNNGLRIDLVLTSAAMSARCAACYVDKTPRTLERPSDHAPVVAEFR